MIFKFHKYDFPWFKEDNISLCIYLQGYKIGKYGGISDQYKVVLWIHLLTDCVLYVAKCART